jgi:hypothetical protein
MRAVEGVQRAQRRVRHCYGQAWCEAARQLTAEADIPLVALRIGHLDGRVGCLTRPACPSVVMTAAGEYQLVFSSARPDLRRGRSAAEA